MYTLHWWWSLTLCSAGAQRALVSVSATSRRLRAVSDSAALWRRLYARRFLAHSPFARLDLYEHIPPFRLAHEDRERALLSCWPGEDRWRDAFVREARWSSGKNVHTAVARIPDRVAMTTGRNVLVDERDPEKPVIFVSCGNGRIHSFRYDRSRGAGAELRKKKVYSISNVGTRAILGVMRIKDAYMTGLHQTDELLIARAHGTIKVFRKGSTWAKLGVATGDGFPTLAVNRERMWMASSAWGRPGVIALHDLGAARAVSQFTLEGTGSEPGMVSKHNHLIVGSPQELALFDLRSGKKERDLISDYSGKVKGIISAQFEEDSDASSFLVTAYDARSTYVYDWDSLELQREVPGGGYDVSFRRGIVALATSRGAHIADAHSSRSGFLEASGLGKNSCLVGMRG